MCQGEASRRQIARGTVRLDAIVVLPLLVEPTVKDLLAGRDGMLIRALEVLRDPVQ